MSEDFSKNPNAIPLQCKAFTERDAVTYVPKEGDDTVVCMAFGVFSTEDFKEMGFAGCTPVFMVGSGMNRKPMLEPFFVMGKSDDTKLMIQGFFSDVFNAYVNRKGQSESDDQGDEHTDGSSPEGDLDNS